MKGEMLLKNWFDYQSYKLINFSNMSDKEIIQNSIFL